MRRAGIFAFLLVLSMPPLVYGQDDIGEQIRRSQDRLEEIRQEQDRLAREATQMRGQIRSVGDEILNIEARIGSSTSALAEFDVQIDAYALSVDEATRDMLATRDELVIRRTELQQRLRNIYQRGRTHVLQVILQAESFGDLISRYKYLHLVALYDRILVEDVRTLAERLSDQRERLADEYARLATLRADKRREVEDLELLEDQRQRRLQNVRSQVTQAEDRISELREEERRLGSLIAELERTRREAERLAGLVSESSVTTADLGQLRWPVEGTIVYRFRDTKPGGVGSWDGIGIGAPRGTLVRAVEAGQVAWAGSRDLLGQTVIVDHGGGYWSVYLYLQDLRVRMDDRIVAGQVIGGVGGDENSEEGTHIEFQIHEPDGDNNPRLVDPVPWLRSRS
ncbi:MAG: peptidoglycan DD-metalloendopeptidase family protein [Gemmatimonadota bacterium]|nr:peptidoglycan DD-metalloendopeptidase family protein [Gemmatimonadota bacterium]